MKQGRPTKYKKEFAKRAYEFALLGATNEEMASFFEINIDTLYEWQKKHKSFSDALKDGKLKADAKVGKSLFKRATGYSYVETRRETDVLGIEKVTTTKKEVPPDVAAQNIWLKNRRGRIDPEKGQKWADKHEVEHSGNVSNDNLSELPTAELIERAKAIKEINKTKS